MGKMTRKEVRNHAFKILFQLKFFKVPQVLEKIDLYWTTQEVEEGRANEGSIIYEILNSGRVVYGTAWEQGFFDREGGGRLPCCRDSS